MQMRVKAQVLSPGVQYRHHARFGMKFCKGKLCYRLPYTPEQQVIHHYRLMDKQPVQQIGNRKYHMKIRNRQQILFAILDPCFTLDILAFGTMAIAAGIVADAYVPACIAPVDMPAQFTCPAATYRT